MRSSILCVGMMACLVAGLVSCSRPYEAEKAYWNLNRQYGKTVRNAAAAPEKDFRGLVRGLQELVTRYPDWQQSAGLQFLIGQMYVSRGEYREGHEGLRRVYVNFPQERELCARAMFFNGMVYEKEGEFASAVKEYRRVTEVYPLTQTGLEVPLYLAERLRANGRAEESAREYDNALRRYRDYIERNPYAKQVPVFCSFLAKAYGSQGRWEEAAGELVALAGKHPDCPAAPGILYQAAVIHRDRLARPDAAIRLLNRVLREYPERERGRQIRFELGALNVALGKFDQAEREFRHILQESEGEGAVCAAAHFALGSCFEKAGKWERAREEYRRVENEYPESREALQVPLVMVSHYHRSGERGELLREADLGARKYRQFLERRNRRETEIAVRESLAALYSLQERWPESRQTLEELYRRYPAERSAAPALFKMAFIAQEKLRDVSAATRLYTELIERFPGHALAENARQRLKEMGAS